MAPPDQRFYDSLSRKQKWGVGQFVQVKKLLIHQRADSMPLIHSLNQAKRTTGKFAW